MPSQSKPRAFIGSSIKGLTLHGQFKKSLSTTFNARFGTKAFLSREKTPIEVLTKALTGLLQLAALSFRTIKYWSGFAGDF
jgi:hypothetical protein